MGLAVCGQDIHFSQFDMAPLHYSPAFAGAFNGDFRAMGIHRSQWRAVTEPYRTFGAAADWNEFNDLSGVNTGFSIYQDQAGDSRLRQLHVNAMGSFRMDVTDDSTQHVFLGVQLGFNHIRVDYDALRFDNQFNGTAYDPDLPNGEAFARNARTIPNVGFGIAYQGRWKEKHRVTVGLGFQNLIQPDVSFFDATGVNLGTRTSLMATAEIRINDQIDALPSLLWQRQTAYREFLIGAAGRYRLESEGPYQALLAGFYFRTGDAGYLMVGGEYDVWRLGISYDFNFSNLQPASNGRGGLEIVLQYIFKDFKPGGVTRRWCPDYL